MITLAPLVLFALVQTVSGNFPRDLNGPVDVRPNTWGTAEAAVLPIVFTAPTGYRVRVLTLRGDVVAWIKTLPGDPATPLESAAGILGGFQTSRGMDNTWPVQCSYCDGGTPLYVQGAVGERQPVTRIAFDYRDVDTLLDEDNTLNAKIASWLNTTGKPIHMEITYTIQFRYERCAPAR